MQTFLPYPDYSATAKVLDYKRLGKQRVECKQILLAMQRGNGGWARHPATLMWASHKTSLCLYAIAMCSEWLSRGYKDTLLPWFTNEHHQLLLGGYIHTDPSWIGDEALHASHRSNLLRKDPIYYSQFGWTETPDLEYVWPVPG